MASSTKTRKPTSVPRPSASVILISPTNQVLLLHRVQTSSSFPSAHVFPGGNLSAQHDGAIPAVDSWERHQDGPAYRLAAIRETFEESGILLARRVGTEDFIELEDDVREEARKAVHGGRLQFQRWLEDNHARADTDNLIPFTRWITPTTIPKRFTTQMYLYFLPLPSSPSPSPSSNSNPPRSQSPPIPPTSALIPVPTSDGGIEHTTARFLPAATWLAQARAGEIILFTPQFYLLHLIAPFLSPSSSSSSPSPPASQIGAETTNTAALARQRAALLSLVRNPAQDPPWAEMCISPQVLIQRTRDGRTVLGLDKPGPELEGSGRRGDGERVVLLRFGREGPRDAEVVGRREMFAREREGGGGGREGERL